MGGLSPEQDQQQSWSLRAELCRTRPLQIQLENAKLGVTENLEGRLSWLVQEQMKQ